MKANNPTQIEVPLVGCRDLRKSFGPVEALRGVTFEIRKGECFGLLGPNGAVDSLFRDQLRVLYSLSI